MVSPSSLLVSTHLIYFLRLDINSRMPRSEAESIFNLIKPIGKSSLTSLALLVELDVTQTALELDENLYINIMGSFRRFARWFHLMS